MYVFAIFLGIFNTGLTIFMAFLDKINWNFLGKNSQNSSGIDPSAPVQQSITPSTPKNLAELHITSYI
ncbi:hypothetical protein LC653_16330 [Nostoc sp. CHAB 5784]|nr:hypothetical protein [Nostoc mirabile CHAB5784]